MIGFQAFAHEGHDKTPGSVTAPHGGQLKGTSQLYVELVPSTSGVKLYAVDHEMKSIAIKDVKIEGTVSLPKKKAEKLTLKASESYLEAKVDAKGAHRYTLDLLVGYKGKTETVSFNVEPQE
jgi:hypothetical protein